MFFLINYKCQIIVVEWKVQYSPLKCSGEQVESSLKFTLVKYKYVSIVLK